MRCCDFRRFLPNFEESTPSKLVTCRAAGPLGASRAVTFTSRNTLRSVSFQCSVSFQERRIAYYSPFTINTIYTMDTIPFGRWSHLAAYLSFDYCQKNIKLLIENRTEPCPILSRPRPAWREFGRARMACKHFCPIQRTYR